VPGDGPEEVRALLCDALGDLASRVIVEDLANQPASASPIETPLYRQLASCLRAAYPQAQLQPSTLVAATDSRHFRRRGTVCYGAGLYSPKVTVGEFFRRLHGDDERIDVESLALTTRLWLDLVPAFLDGHPA
jgi:acetylornithine deacetylase/succinyl-diaminopimelate desuccinylase-like protein